jgi:glutamyl/glutaminyl-tRNA synthetase
LSKRHGDTAVAHFREEGYLPAALANYLALLGWSGEEGREIYGLGELIKKFSLERVSRSPAIFNDEKLNWVNRTHLKAVPGDKKLELARPFLERKGLHLAKRDEPWWQDALEVVWGEVDHLSQLADPLAILCDDDDRWAMETEAQSLLQKEESRKILEELQEELRTVEEVDADNYRRILSRMAQRLHLSGRGLYMPLRAALTGKTRGPELDKIFILLGKKRVLQRVEFALRPAESGRSRQGES